MPFFFVRAWPRILVLCVNMPIGNVLRLCERSLAIVDYDSPLHVFMGHFIDNLESAIVLHAIRGQYSEEMTVTKRLLPSLKNVLYFSKNSCLHQEIYMNKKKLTRQIKRIRRRNLWSALYCNLRVVASRSCRPSSWGTTIN